MFPYRFLLRTCKRTENQKEKEWLEENRDDCRRHASRRLLELFIRLIRVIRGSPWPPSLPALKMLTSAAEM
jgi:hypothetical protein